MTGFRLKANFSGVWTFFSTLAACHFLTDFILLSQRWPNVGIIFRYHVRRADTEMWSVPQDYQLYVWHKVHGGLLILRTMLSNHDHNSSRKTSLLSSHRLLTQLWLKNRKYHLQCCHHHFLQQPWKFPQRSQTGALTESAWFGISVGMSSQPRVVWLSAIISIML